MFRLCAGSHQLEFNLRAASRNGYFEEYFAAHQRVSGIGHCLPSRQVRLRGLFITHIDSEDIEWI
jgi:hypothetical protein